MTENSFNGGFKSSYNLLLQQGIFHFIFKIKYHKNIFLININIFDKLTATATNNAIIIEFRRTSQHLELFSHRIIVILKLLYIYIFVPKCNMIINEVFSSIKVLFNMKIHRQNGMEQNML